MVADAVVKNPNFNPVSMSHNRCDFRVSETNANRDVAVTVGLALGSSIIFATDSHPTNRASPSAWLMDSDNSIKRGPQHRYFRFIFSLNEISNFSPPIEPPVVLAFGSQFLVGDKHYLSRKGRDTGSGSGLELYYQRLTTEEMESCITNRYPLSSHSGKLSIDANAPVSGKTYGTTCPGCDGVMEEFNVFLMKLETGLTTLMG